MNYTVKLIEITKDKSFDNGRHIEASFEAFDDNGPVLDFYKERSLWCGTIKLIGDSITTAGSHEEGDDEEAKIWKLIEREMKGVLARKFVDEGKPVPCEKLVLSLF